MAKEYDSLVPHLRNFIQDQQIFFVATAPLSADGSVNLSPKGLDCFRVLGPRTVAYQDLTGSGNETAAHILENGRVTVMFCSFSKKPMILRIYGRGASISPSSEQGRELGGLFPDEVGVRQYVRIDVMRVRTSCGFGVPEAPVMEERDLLRRWSQKKGEHGLEKYRAQWNGCSIDGVPIEK